MEHSQSANEEAFLAYGVTSLRDTGDGLSWLISQQDRSESTGLPVPRYFYSGEIFEGDRPFWGDAFLQIDNETDARDYVPWQNGVAERWVGSCRRELLEHVIALNERHLKRLLSEYVPYYHEDRTHLGLSKGTPGCRTRWVTSGRVLAHDRMGGLHHRYDWAA